MSVTANTKLIGAASLAGLSFLALLITSLDRKYGWKVHGRKDWVSDTNTVATGLTLSEANDIKLELRRLSYADAWVTR